MPVACLAIAALVAFAVARSRRGVLVPALVAALLLVDLHVHVYGASAADERNTAYAALRAAPPGRVLELPVFLPDLHYYRSKCGARDLPVAIAFMDIDKFKDFNTTVGHTDVNRHVLPVFMGSVEAHIYGHGYAYRMSGDEYALLMPNADADLA